MARKTKKVDQYVLETLTKAGLKGDELTKYLIIWKRFYVEIMPATGKMTGDDLKLFAGKFLQFVIEFETICVRAHKPSGSGSTASDIISMYSAREIQVDQEPSLKANVCDHLEWPPISQVVGGPQICSNCGEEL